MVYTHPLRMEPQSIGVVCLAGIEPALSCIQNRRVASSPQTGTTGGICTPIFPFWRRVLYSVELRSHQWTLATGRILILLLAD